MNLETKQPWTLIVIAGLLEIVWALGFKYVPENAPWYMQAVIFVALIASFVLLADAMKQLPAGTAYAVWTGIGATGVAILGMMFFREPVTLARCAFIALIVIGIVGLKFSGDNHAA